nr:MAG TPA: minor tail protein [Caudoviricetes sp.]
MADRIKGISVEIGGDTKGLSKALSNVNKEISTTQKDLKDVERLLKLDPGNTELLRQKYDLLNKSIESTETKLDSLKDAEKQVQAQFQRGDIGEDQYNALKREVIETEAKLGKLRSEAQNADNAIRGIDEKPIKEVTKAADDAGDSLQEAGKEASNFGDFLKADAIVEGSKAIISGLKDIAEESKEYMKIMGSLEISSQNAGYTADQTAQSYKALYGVLADEQTAATTTANLQAIGLSQQQLGQIINGTIGAWATYGDSIPIDGLAEAINETVKTGNVTGTFADVLNWAGTSEDAFNKKLQSTNSESKRANLILQELANQGLIQAGEAWQENNEALVENNQANADLKEQLAKLGETVMPVITAITQGIADLLGWFNGLSPEVQGFIEIVLGLVAAIGPISGIIKGISVAQAALNAVMNANPIFLIISAIAGLVAAFIYLWNNCEEFREFWINLWNGIKDFFISAWEGIKAFFTETIPNMFNDLVNWFKELPGRIWEWLVSVVQSIIQWIIDLNTTVNEGISNFISGIVDWFAQLPGRIWEWLVNVVQSVLQWIVDMNKKVNDGIKNMIDGIINWFKELPGRIWDWLVNVVKNIAKWVIDMNKKASDGIREFVDTIINKVKELPGKFLEWGKDMIQNFINGIKSMIGKLGDAVGNIAGTIASFLHFSVPDEGPLVDQPKWMPDMIDNMIQGINQNKHKLVEAMDNMAFDMSGSMMVSPAGNGYGANSTTTNTTNNSFGGMTVNVYSNGDMAQTAEQIAAEIQQAAMRKGMVFA